MKTVLMFTLPLIALILIAAPPCRWRRFRCG